MSGDPKALAKIQEALRRIERAQYELDNACAALSPVRGLVEEWERLGKLSQRVQAEWHRLNRRASSGRAFSLDSEIEP